MEIWKDVNGYEGMYKVSNYGRVKSMPKLRRRSEKILVPQKMKSGYLCVDLGDGSSIKRHLIHRLVCLSFYDNQKDQVNHKDGDKLNNRLENLEWCSRSENQKHAIKNGLRSAKGENNSQSKLNTNQVIEIRELLKLGITLSEISKKYNISIPSVSDIKRGHTWTHI